MNAPRLTFVTDGRGDVLRLARTLASVIDAGIDAVQLREPLLSRQALVALSQGYREVLRARGGSMWVNACGASIDGGPLQGVDGAICDGIWLSQKALAEDRGRLLRPAERALSVPIGVSVHDAVELQRAEQGGADIVSLAPLFPTMSKPGHRGLGVRQALGIVQAATVPVLLLGGIDALRVADLRPLAAAGAAGVMVMSAISTAGDVAGAVRGLRVAVERIW